MVIEALKYAMEQCRPDWSKDFRDWVCSLVKFSIDSAVGVFEDQWYKQKIGIPTGGSLCVQLANITVFYIMQKVIYSNPEMMKNITSIKRYIDDGGGTCVESKEEFILWLKKANILLAPYNLIIDEFSFEPPGSFVPLLDIKYCFDINGKLQTDLYVKETDSRAYLSFGSCHPNHVYSGIVFSQCLRLRRIINCDERLKLRLQELKDCFKKCNYPETMINNIVKRV